MQRSSSLLASGLLLLIILLSVSLVALTATPSRGVLQTATSIVVKRETTKTNTTFLAVKLSFPNGTIPQVGTMNAGTFESEFIDRQYVFGNITPGQYKLNWSGSPDIYFPSVQVEVTPGMNSLNITVFQQESFDIFVTAGPELNGTVPAPSIRVLNNTVVQFFIHNNTTLIQNLAVVSSLNNTNYSSIMFNSLSNNIGAGGSSNDTFVVSHAGKFFYECLIGNDARAGEYGEFIVD